MGGRVSDDPWWVENTQTVDAIDKDVVQALESNPGWRLIGVGVGAGGQTTLTFGWPWGTLTLDRRPLSRREGDGRAVNSDTYQRLPTWQRQQADAVAEILRARCGAYSGSESDALTDATDIVLAVRFAPPTGDNHHNAALCPYCSPQP